MALLEDADSDTDNNDDGDTVDTARLEEMAQEVQLMKQFNQSFSVHDAVALSKSSGGAATKSTVGRKRRNSVASAIDRDFIVSALTQNDLFLDLNLSRERIVDAAAKFERTSYSDGTVIVEQGDDDFASMCWYLIAKGRCQVLIDGQPLPRLGRYGGLVRGKTFGEVSLIKEEARSATIVAEGEVVLYQLSRKDFLSVVEMDHAGTSTSILDAEEERSPHTQSAPNTSSNVSSRNFYLEQQKRGSVLLEDLLEDVEPVVSIRVDTTSETNFVEECHSTLSDFKRR